jgi:hypothetical protein
MIVSEPAAEADGPCIIGADVLADARVTDLSGCGGGVNPVWDIFLDRP